MTKISSFLYYKYHDASKMNRSIHIMKLTPSLIKKLTKISYKTYKNASIFKLTRRALPDIQLEHLLKMRKSTRKFTQRAITLEEIGDILYYSAGIVREKKYRSYPSAGARYPLELYLIALNTELPRGIYHYNVKKDYVEQIHLIHSFSSLIYFNQLWPKNGSCHVIITSVFNRTIDKYGNRGYRYILMEAGHMTQNLSLVCEALSLGGCIIGGFIEDKLNKLLGIDGVHETVLSVFTIGEPS